MSFEYNVPSGKLVLQQPDPILSQTSVPVKPEEYSEVKEFSEKLIQTMKICRGVGISAPQVGVLKRVIVVCNPDDSTITTMINPIVMEKGDKVFKFKEGCLSAPGIQAIVERPSQISVGYTDLNGAAQVISAEGLYSTIIQHEVDHLNGIEFTARASKFSLRKALEKAKKNGFDTKWVK